VVPIRGNAPRTELIGHRSARLKARDCLRSKVLTPEITIRVTSKTLALGKVADPRFKLLHPWSARASDGIYLVLGVTRRFQHTEYFHILQSGQFIDRTDRELDTNMAVVDLGMLDKTSAMQEYWHLLRTLTENAVK
jgi:hypothetical protein